MPTGDPHPVWVTNQHESPLVRPADVAVYVASDSVADLDSLFVHLAVQETETLHAVIVLGPLCRDDSKLRWVACSRCASASSCRLVPASVTASGCTAKYMMRMDLEHLRTALRCGACASVYACASACAGAGAGASASASVLESEHWS